MPFLLLGSLGLALLFWIGRGMAAQSIRYASIGEESRKGYFAYTVTSVKAGIPQSTYIAGAQGQFVEVDVEVKNVSADTPHVFLANLYVGKTSYDPDYDAGTIMKWQGSLDLIGPISPGKEVSGPLVFALPSGAKPTRLMLYGASSGSVIIKLPVVPGIAPS